MSKKFRQYFGILSALTGAIATAIAAYVLAGLRNKICRSWKKTFMAAMYYITIAMLFLDPLYLSAIRSFVGGGDMNGIKLLVPEIAARIAFGVIFMVNLAVFIKVILPTYRQAFNNNNNNKNN